MTDKITATGALRWMRDRFAGWLASVTVFSFLWLAVGIAVAVLFVWDGVWSRHQAPSNLDPLTFQGAGWVMRLWTVFALAGAVWCFRHKAAVAGSLMALTWVATSLMTYGHALGFIATGQAERYTIAASVEKVETVAVTSGADQIIALESQKTTIREDRDREADRLATLISEVQTNRVASDDHLAEVYAAQRDTVMAASRARLDEIDAQILAVLNTKQEAQTVAAGNTENAVKFDPLYILLAEWTDGQKGPPSDEYTREIAQRVGAFWAFLLEMIGGAGPALLYSIHAHAAERRPQVTEEYSEDVPAGFVRAEVPEEEWDEMQEALKVHRNIKQGAKKGATTRRQGNKIHRANEYAMGRIEEVRARFADGMSVQQMARKWNQTINQFRYELEGYVNKDLMDAEEFTVIFGFAPSANPERPEADDAINGWEAVKRGTARNLEDEEEPEPEPETETAVEEDVSDEPPVAVADSPQDEPDPELTIPDEPKEWGITPYEPPANEDEEEDQDEPKEAASV